MILDKAREALDIIDPTTAASIAVAIAVTAILWRLFRRRTPALGELARRAKPSRVDRILTFAGAGMASVAAGYTMWLIMTHAGMPTWLRWGVLAFVEINTVASALRSRRFRLLYAASVDELLKTSPGAVPPPRGRDIDGVAVWCIAALSASLGLFESRSVVEAIARVAAPLIAAFSWERALVGELAQYGTRRASTIRWANPIERIAVRLGMATPTDQYLDVADADRERRVALVVDAGYRLEAPPAVPFGIGKAVAHARYHRRLRGVQRRYGLTADVVRQIRAGVAALHGARHAVSPAALADIDPWQHPEHLAPAPPAAQARRAVAELPVPSRDVAPRTAAVAHRATPAPARPAAPKPDPYVTYADEISRVQAAIDDWKDREQPISQGDVARHAGAAGRVPGVPTQRKIKYLIEALANRDPAAAIAWLVENDVLSAEQAADAQPLK